MRALRVALLSALLCMGLTGTASAVVDEQWPAPNTWQDGHYHLLVSDTIDFFSSFSRMETELNGERLLCTSTESGDCAKSDWLPYNATLPACTESTPINCIAGLNAVHADGRVDTAKFEYYTTPNHPNQFAGNPALKVPESSSPSAWTLPDTPHSMGTLYGLAVSLTGGADRRNPSAPTKVSVMLTAVSRFIGAGGPTDANNFENYPKCIQRVNPNTGKREIGCGSGAEELGKYSCAFKMNTNGDCLLRQPLPQDVRFRLTIRLADQPSGWLHGRLTDPEISIVKEASGAVQLTVTAAPMTVPVFYAGGFYNDLPKNVQDYYAQCLPSSKCLVGSRQARPFLDPLPLPERNVMDQPTPYSAQARLGMLEWMQYAKDTAVAVPSSWTFRTLQVGGEQERNACLKPDSSGVKGIVTTNATAYSDGPPAFIDNQLSYTVMAPHFRPDGTTPFQGRYNLVLRSDVARCLYGFSSAPLQAKIEVVDNNGAQSVAVTSVAESGGWLSLAASGFTFSGPTINVQLTQPQAPAPVIAPTAKKKTITCVNPNTKRSTKVTAIVPKCPKGFQRR